MALVFSLDQLEYEALIALARRGATTEETNRRLDEFLQNIERKNGITRDSLWVQWQEMDAPLPAGTVFPTVWPPEMRYHIELVTRRIARADVDAVVTAHATNPTNVLVTRDSGATLGWTPVDDFFV